jgi:hypothetical protein
MCQSRRDDFESYSGGITLGEVAVCLPHGWPFVLGVPSSGKDGHARWPEQAIVSQTEGG